VTCCPASRCTAQFLERAAVIDEHAATEAEASALQQRETVLQRSHVLIHALRQRREYARLLQLRLGAARRLQATLPPQSPPPPPPDAAADTTASLGVAMPVGATSPSKHPQTSMSASLALTPSLTPSPSTPPLFSLKDVVSREMLRLADRRAAVVRETEQQRDTIAVMRLEVDVMRRSQRSFVADAAALQDKVRRAAVTLRCRGR
jgi:hypothetical protein